MQHDRKLVTPRHQIYALVRIPLSADDKMCIFLQKRSFIGPNNYCAFLIKRSSFKNVCTTLATKLKHAIPYKAIEKHLHNIVCYAAIHASTRYIAADMLLPQFRSDENNWTRIPMLKQERLAVLCRLFTILRTRWMFD